MPFDGSLIEVKRGQKLTSIRKLCERWGWSNTKVTKFLKLLETDGMITYFSDTKKTLITIVNYSDWQDNENKKTSQKRHRNISETSQKHTNKNVKNDKECKEDIYISVQHLSMTKIEYDKLVSIYGQEKVTNKIGYAENYAKLKNYKSLYLTLNNWLSSDAKKDQTQKPTDFYRRVD